MCLGRMAANSRFIDLILQDPHHLLFFFRNEYSKTCVKRSLSKRPKISFQDQLSLNVENLMQVKSIAECSNGSILQYFRHSLSYHLSLRSLLCLLLSGRFTQVLM